MPARSPFVSTQSFLDPPPNSGCPGLFCPTTAQDGILARIRVPGGLLSAAQCRGLAEIVDYLGGSVHVTNRANLQMRGLQRSVPADILQQLQWLGLAAPLWEMDHLRNIMASPTAGIDQAQQTDTRPLVRALSHALSSQLSLAALSPKFSIGIDGGEQVSIVSLPNDVTLVAKTPLEGLRFAVCFRDIKLKRPLLLPSQECQSFVRAAVMVYLEMIEQREFEVVTKPRLKHLIELVGIQHFLAQIQTHLDFSLTFCKDTPPTPSSGLTYGHLGIHPQRQSDLSYLGVVLPLGHLSVSQLSQIATLSETYGSASIRLTPWRNLIVSDIQNRDLLTVQEILREMGLSASATNIWGGLVACSGSTGCAASATDTQSDAAAIVQLMSGQPLDAPVTIHLSGCEKSCAYHGSSDITLVGTQTNEISSYSLYVGNLGTPFGQLLATRLNPAEVPQCLSQLLNLYQSERSGPEQSFCTFVEQHFDRLQQWLESQRSTVHA